MKKKLIILALILISVSTALFVSIHLTKAGFSDIEGHPNEAAINYVQSEGIVSGYPDGTYQPDRILNRAEFTKIIIAARYSSEEIGSCKSSKDFFKKKVFSDIDIGVWFEPFTCLAKKKEVIGGFPDGTFKGEQEIIFAEAAKITVNSYGLNTKAKDPWYMPFIDKLEELNAIPDELAVNPAEKATLGISRGQMAEIIYRLRNIKDVISSEDGEFSLRIPESALPKGTDLKSLSIKRLSEEENPVEEINGAPMVFYELEPEGIKFKKPITFEISTAIQANIIPLVFLVSDGDFEMLPEPTIEIDQINNLASISGQLSHFSGIVIANIDMFEAILANPGNQVTDVAFAPRVSIKRKDTVTEFNLKGVPNTLTILDDWSISRGLFQVLTGPISPSQLYDPKNKVDFSTNETFTATNEVFTCTEKSETAEIGYTAQLELEFQKTTVAGSLTEKVKGPNILLNSGNFECIETATEQELLDDSNLKPAPQEGEEPSSDLNLQFGQTGSEIPEIVVASKDCILKWYSDLNRFNRFECGWHFQFKDGTQGVCAMASKHDFSYKAEYPNLKPEADFAYLFLLKNNMVTHYNTGDPAYTHKYGCDTNTDDLKLEFVVYEGSTVYLSIYDVNPSIFTYNGDGDMLTVSGP